MSDPAAGNAYGLFVAILAEAKHGARKEKKRLLRSISFRTVYSPQAAQWIDTSYVPQSHCNFKRRWRWETGLPRAKKISPVVISVSQASASAGNGRWLLCHHAVHEAACARRSQGKSMCLVQTHVA